MTAFNAKNRNIDDLISSAPVLFDGAMGSTISSYDLKPGDFGGHPGCNEILNRTRPDIIADIHRRFFKSGAVMVETNTFGGTPIKLEEWGLRDDALELNRLAAEIAHGVADEEGGYVIGSMGPSGLLPTMPDYEGLSPSRLADSFAIQAEGLIKGGVDVLLVETSEDILEFKSAIIGCRDAIEKTGRTVPIWGSVSLHMNGRMLMGTPIDAALNVALAMGVEVFGLNCATGPSEMTDAVRFLSEHSPIPVIVFPNQGMPASVDGRLAYTLPPEKFAEAMIPFLKMGVEIVGGCCGTSPEYIGELKNVLEIFKPRLKPRRIFGLASAMTSQEIQPEGSPLIIGERLNSFGSKKFKKMLLAENWPGIVDIANQQNESGAMALDLALAVDGRDNEPGDYQYLVHRIASEVPLPIMIDSINPDAVKSALENNPGIGIVNSINLENRVKAEKVLGYIKKYGGAIVAMTIDEKGMAKSVGRKIEVADRFYSLIVDEYRLPPESILFDLLTFTLATGEGEYRDMAKSTLEGIKTVRAKYPQCGAILGISNVSYGLNPPARKLINAVFLHRAIQNGLTAAIVNPLDVGGFHDFSPEQIELADDLIFNRRDNALERLIKYTESEETQKIKIPEREIVHSPEQWLTNAILDRKESGIEDLIDACLEKSSPVDVVNEILLPAMKEVGDRMERRETILPHVLRSAEIMKKALKYLEPLLGSGDMKEGRTIVLATVFGDVHDIGKNLVKAIVSNNGFNVIDLGKQVSVNDVVETVRREKPMAVGLSALLVATASEMGSYVAALHENNLDVPVIIGGAAVSPGLAKKFSIVNGEKHKGGVYYAKDAFGALDICRELAGEKTDKAEIHGASSAGGALRGAVGTGDPVNDDSEMAKKYAAWLEFLRRTANGEDPKEVLKEQDDKAKPIKPDSEKERFTKPATPKYSKPENPPFIGVSLTQFSIEDILSGITDEDRASLHLDPAVTIQAVMDATGFETVLDPKGLYGFFGISKSGQTIQLKADDKARTETRDMLYTFTFPDKKKSVPNWLNDEDYLIPYVATLGSVAVDTYQKLESANQLALSLEWSDLCALLTEIVARLIRSRIALDLNLPPNTPVLGVSPGYALWPDLSDQSKIQEILNWQTIGLSLTDRHQIVPEFSTSGIAVIHPKARY
ncbi:MAG: homocysteine S-methyltransferase family protein [bacterium]|nr:homocysteine S-methyltransferase family protein [bacterium]